MTKLKCSIFAHYEIQILTSTRTDDGKNKETWVSLPFKLDCYSDVIWYLKLHYHAAIEEIRDGATADEVGIKAVRCDIYNKKEQVYPRPGRTRLDVQRERREIESQMGILRFTMGY